MKFATLQEGKATVRVPVAKTVSKDLPVFYNPAMTVNRDISIALLASLGRKNIRVADILAGSGVRAIRMVKEIPSVIESILVNDGNPDFKKTFMTNVKLSKAVSSKCTVSVSDANELLHRSGGFDYIDIDPFGSPAPFIDAAARHLSRDGILALTATDTAALAGTSVEACRRKYWAVPLRNHLMHEVGMRILARKAQLVAAQYDRALIPIYCHSTLHYTRLYLQSAKSKEAVADVLDMHRSLAYETKTDEFGMADRKKNSADHLAGPLWTGQLWDAALAKRIAAKVSGTDTTRITKMIAEESKIPTIGFYDIHRLAGKAGLDAPSFESVIMKLKKQGYAAARTHFSPSGLRTDAPLSIVKKALKK